MTVCAAVDSRSVVSKKGVCMNNTFEKATYIKPEIEDLGTLSSRTESNNEPNEDDLVSPGPSANPGVS
jgi:hypothetical protein